ncbi:MAG TPA: pilus assembly protein N-terminal domain-containing protein [Vicinamibacterales bacterium]|nr:pilus assembly protein N-terminal domain-containing protein [Vicinamibacterales bacterium]
MRSGRGAAKMIALVVYIIVILVATPQAQKPASFSGSPGAMTAGPAAAASSATSVDLLVGRSTILNVGAPISRVSLTVPDIADAMVTSPQQLLIHGKTPGVISLFVWDRAGGITTYEVNVRRDLSQLIEQMKQLFPGEPISVTSSGKDVVIAGTVSSKYVIDKAADVAGGYVEKKENIVNLLKQAEGQSSNQVLLRVRFAEVSRSALQQLGAAFVANGYNNQWFGRTTTQQFAAPDFDSSKANGLTFSDFLNVFLFNTKHDIGAVVKALQTKGLFESLAEPNLIASNGKEASFLAGGEYPYPVTQGGSGNNAVTIVFKEFGIRLSFTPTVLNGDLINLKVRPEVSSLDFANGVSISGFRVPALSTRRTETEVELQDGQTFAIAGLMNNTVENSMSKIPGIGDIPVLGYLFRSRAFQKQQTELVVMITPQILRRGSTGVSQGLPNIPEQYLAPPSKSYPQPAPYTGSPVTPPTRNPRTGGGTSNEPDATAPAAQPSAPAPVAPAPKTPASTAAVKSAPAQSQPPVAASTYVRPQAEAVVKPRSVAASTPEPKPDPKLEAKQRDDARKAADQARKAADAQKAADKKAAEEKAVADQKAAEEKAVADKKAATEKVRQDKLDAERAKREAEVAKKVAEADRKKQEDLKKHEKALAEAAERLRQAQTAYQAEIDKKKGIQE